MLAALHKFDTFRAIFISAILCLAFYWGVKTQHYAEAFSIASGAMFAYFPNIEGNNTERFWGILCGIIWAQIFYQITFYIHPISLSLKIPVIILMVFGSCMLSVFGSRGVMIGFGGLFAIAVGTAIHNYAISASDIFYFSSLGSLCYLAIAVLSHVFFQPSNIDGLLAQKCTLIKVYMQSQFSSLFKIQEIKEPLLGTMVKINALQELLRGMLMPDRNITFFAGKKRRQLSLFRELIDLNELAVAAPNAHSVANIEQYLMPFQKTSEVFIEKLEELRIWILKGGKAPEVKLFDEILRQNTETITQYIQDQGLPRAREGALYLRTLQDYFESCFQKISTICQIDQQLVDNETHQKYLSVQNYHPKQILESMHFRSPTFRFSFRVSIAILLGLLIGHFMDPIYSNWIIVTIIVVMRPSYVITKKRAYSRLFGTVLGVGFAFLLSSVQVPAHYWGVMACLAIFFGFVHINHHYAIASALITFAILSLFHFQNIDLQHLLLDRIKFSVIGIAIVIFVNYSIFPVWEKYNFKLYLRKVLKSNLEYFEAINEMYHHKSASNLPYRLARKKAFVENGTIATAFENIRDEPKSIKKESNNFNALIFLNHSFLSNAAAFSTYIQSHATTEVSESFETIRDYIIQNLQAAIAHLENKKYKYEVIDIEGSFDKLVAKYKKMNDQRDQEIINGSSTMTDHMRSKLMEGRMILEKMEAFIELSENIRSCTEILD